MKIAAKLLLAGALTLGQSSGAEPPRSAEPAARRDPPGEVSVDQPAGVSLRDRDTARDETDTLGGGATDVIDGRRAGRRAAGPSLRPSEARGGVQAGTEARARFEAGPGAAAPARPPDRPAPPPATTGPAAEAEAQDSTALGTDLGYGTGTEPVPPAPSR